MNHLTPPLNVIPNLIGRERSDRQSKSRQLNLKNYLPAGVSTPVKAKIRSN